MGVPVAGLQTGKPLDFKRCGADLSLHNDRTCTIFMRAKLPRNVLSVLSSQLLVSSRTPVLQATLLSFSFQDNNLIVASSPFRAQCPSAEEHTQHIRGGTKRSPSQRLNPEFSESDLGKNRLGLLVEAGALERIAAFCS